MARNVNPKGGAGIGQLVAPQLLTTEEAEWIVNSVVAQNFRDADIGRAIQWCNQARINAKLVDGILLGQIIITHFTSQGPVFAVRDETTKADIQPITTPQEE